MSDLWDEIKDWWESDSVYREQIVLAVIVGAIGFAWAMFEVAARHKLNV